MPFDPNKKNNEPKFMIRFRGSAMIPRLNRMAPCRLELGVTAIKEIMESLHHHPIRIETSYIDVSGKEWPINWTNYRKILPIDRGTAKKSTPQDDPAKPIPVHNPEKENPATGAAPVEETATDKVVDEKTTSAYTLPEPISVTHETAPVSEENKSYEKPMSEVSPNSNQNNYQHGKNKNHRR